MSKYKTPKEFYLEALHSGHAMSNLSCAVIEAMEAYLKQEIERRLPTDEEILTAFPDICSIRKIGIDEMQKELRNAVRWCRAFVRIGRADNASIPIPEQKEEKQTDTYIVVVYVFLCLAREAKIELIKVNSVSEWDATVEALEEVNKIYGTNTEIRSTSVIKL